MFFENGGKAFARKAAEMLDRAAGAAEERGVDQVRHVRRAEHELQLDVAGRAVLQNFQKHAVKCVQPHIFPDPKFYAAYNYVEELESELEEEASHSMTESEALAEMMAAVAAGAESEAEAEAMIGAATVTVLSPRDRAELRRLLPYIVRASCLLTRLLRRDRRARPAVRALPDRDLILDGEVTWGGTTYHVFDIVWRNGEDLSLRPGSARG